MQMSAPLGDTEEVVVLEDMMYIQLSYTTASHL